MRFSKSKSIERFFKKMFAYSYIGKWIHLLRSQFRPNVVFIWIPKNAGTSLYYMLRKYACIKVKEIEHVKYRFSQRGLVTFDHMDYALMLKRGYVDTAFDKSAFKFCICRNPYDRAVSLYVYLTKRIHDKPSFLSFWQQRKNDIDGIGLYNVKGMSHCNPQVRWIENVKIDFIVRYENYNEDINRLMLQLGLPGMKVQHHNSSVRQAYESYYCVESKKIIEKIYAEDFSCFDYEILSDKELLSPG